MNQINGFLAHCVSALLQNCPPQELTSLFIFFVTKLSLTLSRAPKLYIPSTINLYKHLNEYFSFFGQISQTDYILLYEQN